MKKKTEKIFESIRDDLTCRLRAICGKLSPIQRFTAVLSVGSVLIIAYTGILISSICNMGKQDEQKDFGELEITKQLELKISDDSIYSNKNNKNYEYEYEQN